MAQNATIFQKIVGRRIASDGPHPDQQRELALKLIFGSMGESPFNRTMDEYIAIAARAPKLAVLHADINRALGNMAAAGYAPYEICYFKAGDQKIWTEKFPTSLSIETVRQAWIKSGMRELQLWHKEQRGKKRSSH